MSHRILRLIGIAIVLFSIPNIAQTAIYEWTTDADGKIIESSVLCLFGANVTALPGAVLSGLGLASAYMIDKDLTNVDLSNSWCVYAKLSNSNLTGANLTNTQFSFADFSNAVITDTVITGAKFSQCTGITIEQLQSTANYKNKNLLGFGAENIDFTTSDFSDYNLTDASFKFSILKNVNFDNACITGTNFACTTILGFTQAQLQSTSNYKIKDLNGIDLSANDLTAWEFSNQNLSNARFCGAILSNAKFTDAIITGANFWLTTYQGFTQSQLQSTSSYKTKDLTGIQLTQDDLTGWDLSGQNLSYSSFSDSTLKNSDFSNAVITNAIFSSSTGFTLAQLQSTENYKNKELSDIELEYNDLTAWDFSGQNLTHAYFTYSKMTNVNFTGANLTDAQLWGADLRNAVFTKANLTRAWLINANLTNVTFKNTNLYNADFGGAKLNGAIFKAVDLRTSDIDLTGVTITNSIMPDGAINGLHLDKDNPLLTVRNALSWYLIPVHVTQEMQLESGSTLEFILNDKTTDWNSTISFDAGIPISIAADLQLEIDAADPQSLIGTSYQLFDWTGVNPSGQFLIVSDEVWDITHLYTDGTVTLLQVPEPSALSLISIGIIGLLVYINRRRK
jgi:uncharacterized protein YjbI with pentapeptide repeats